MINERILIVDEDIQVLTSYERLLSEAGYKVATVPNMSEAVDEFKKNSYQLVIIDLFLEGMSGIEFLAKITKLSPDSDIILTSGYSSMVTVITILRKNFIDFIVKPCEKEELKFRVQKAFEFRRLKSELKKAEMNKKILETIEAVAHEINTPLSALIRELDLMESSASNINSNLLKNILKLFKRVNDTCVEILRNEEIKTN